MILLSGKEVRDVLKKKLIDEVSLLKSIPELVILQIGNNEESNIYIRQKKKFGESLGIVVNHKSCPVDIEEREIIDLINGFNNDEKVGGIIVQLPIPKNLDQIKILNSIDSKKDVDGLGVIQTGLLYNGDKKAIAPATARGVMSLLDYYKIDLASKHVVVIGRSNLVGRPIAQMCLMRNATVTICHSQTKNLEEITRTADILIVACGRPKFINSSYIKEGQIIVDVGITKTDAGLSGDVDFDGVKSIVSAISPVPGGVGPLTVLSLFQNLVDTQKP